MENQNNCHQIPKKHKLIALALFIVIGVSAYFGSNSYFKGNVDDVPEDGQPDMAIHDIYMDSSNKLTVVHANDGTADVSTATKGYTYIYIYKNSDGSLYKKWTYSWSTLKNKDFLKAGGSSKVQPQKLDSNNYTIHACIDPKNIVTNEQDEPSSFDCASGIDSNNFMQVNLNPKKDLMVSSIDMNTSATMMGTMWWLSVKNIGQADIDESSTTHCTLKNNSKPEKYKDYDFMLDSLAAGEEEDSGNIYGITLYCGDVYEISCTVDANGEIDESDENNTVTEIFDTSVGNCS